MNLPDLSPTLIKVARSRSKWGWVAVFVPTTMERALKRLQREIDPDDLADDGVEKEPHVTIAYGLDNNVDTSRLKLTFALSTPVTFRVEDVSTFTDNPKYDVLKYRVKSGELSYLRRRVREDFGIPGTTYRYNPHVTIAYVKKGKAEKYLKKFKQLVGRSYTTTQAVYNPKGFGKRYRIRIGRGQFAYMHKEAKYYADDIRRALLGERAYDRSYLDGEMEEFREALESGDPAEIEEELQDVMFAAQVLASQGTGADREILGADDKIKEFLRRRDAVEEMFKEKELPFSVDYLAKGSNIKKPQKIKTFFELAGNPITDEEAEDFAARYADWWPEEKTAQVTDMYVMTAVPKENLDSVMKHGVLSLKAMMDNEEVLKKYLEHRGSVLGEEGFDVDEEVKRITEGLQGERSDKFKGPSVFFTDPDPDKVSDPRHSLNKYDTVKLRVNLGQLLADQPDTVVRGVELKPWLPDTDEPEDRQKDLSVEEIMEYISTDPKELWKDYYHGPEDDPYKFYAADVPHAFIHTPSGKIDPKYLSMVDELDKTAEDRVMSADLAYPILVEQDGSVLDGSHRIQKSLLTGEPVNQVVVPEELLLQALVDEEEEGKQYAPVDEGMVDIERLWELTGDLEPAPFDAESWRPKTAEHDDDAAPEGKCWRVLWADGRAQQCFKRKSHAQEFWDSGHGHSWFEGVQNGPKLVDRKKGWRVRNTSTTFKCSGKNWGDEQCPRCKREGRPFKKKKMKKQASSLKEACEIAENVNLAKHWMHGFRDKCDEHGLDPIAVADLNMKRNEVN